ncbi:hypothetical protein KDK77_09190 [bacterium]|nr:hypothetical protein [bacterium]
MENIRIDQNAVTPLPPITNPARIDKNNDAFKKTLETLIPNTPQNNLPHPEQPIQELPVSEQPNSSYKAKNIQEFKNIQKYAQQQPASSNQSYINKTQGISLKQQIKLYKEDQFLAHPGSDNYFIRNGKIEYDTAYEHSDFSKRIGKDITDALLNFNNAILDSLFGAKFRYVDQNGSLQEGKKDGLLGALGKFTKNMFEGIYAKPDTNNPTPNAMDKIVYSGKKILIDGIGKNLFIDVPHSMIDITEDLFIGTLNAFEIVPDATIGNFEAGRKLTTKIFDNGQLAINYISDVLPTGEAWLRVHSFGTDATNRNLPVLFNIKSPQQGLDDIRWESIRNTPFRKAIETVGSIAANFLFFL